MLAVGVRHCLLQVMFVKSKSQQVESQKMVGSMVDKYDSWAVGGLQQILGERGPRTYRRPIDQARAGLTVACFACRQQQRIVHAACHYHLHHCRLPADACC
jgi:hypothetical protein